MLSILYLQKERLLQGSQKRYGISLPLPGHQILTHEKNFWILMLTYAQYYILQILTFPLESGGKTQIFIPNKDFRVLF